MIELLQKVHFASPWWVLLLPITLIGLDVITGLIKAFVQEDFQSAKMRAGFGKKMGEIILLAIGELLTYSLGLPPVVVYGVSLYLTFMELMSNIENLNALGVPMPGWIVKALHTAENTLNADEVEDLRREINHYKEILAALDDAK